MFIYLFVFVRCLSKYLNKYSCMHTFCSCCYFFPTLSLCHALVRCYLLLMFSVSIYFHFWAQQIGSYAKRPKWTCNTVDRKKILGSNIYYSGRSSRSNSRNNIGPAKCKQLALRIIRTNIVVTAYCLYYILLYFAQTKSSVCILYACTCSIFNI